MTAEECRKCHSTITICPSCKNKPGQSILGDRLTCNKCNGTGGVCGTHGGYWK